MLSPEDQEILLSSGVSHDDAARLRPTFETLEASLTEGRYETITHSRAGTRQPIYSIASFETGRRSRMLTFFVDRSECGRSPFPGKLRGGRY